MINCLCLWQCALILLGWGATKRKFWFHVFWPSHTTFLAFIEWCFLQLLFSVCNVDVGSIYILYDGFCIPNMRDWWPLIGCRNSAGWMIGRPERSPLAQSYQSTLFPSQPGGIFWEKREKLVLSDTARPAWSYHQQEISIHHGNHSPVGVWAATEKEGWN